MSPAPHADYPAALRRLLSEMIRARPPHQVCNQSNYFSRDTQCIWNEPGGLLLAVLRPAALGHIVCQNVRTEPKRGGTALDHAADDWICSELECDKCISDQVTIYL